MSDEEAPDNQRGGPLGTASTTWPPSEITKSVPLKSCEHLEHHPRRLAAAAVSACAIHGCPICPFTLTYRGDIGPTGAGDYCSGCLTSMLALVDLEGPVADPWCMSHGIPTPQTWATCTLCEIARRTARSRGWRGRPTWHQGPDCLHCDVCGLCSGSGRVCRDCRRCPEHEVEDWALTDCERYRWSRVQLREVAYFEHTWLNSETGRWAS